MFSMVSVIVLGKVKLLLFVSYNNPNSQKHVIATSEPVFNIVWVILSFTFLIMIYITY